MLDFIYTIDWRWLADKCFVGLIVGGVAAVVVSCFWPGDCE